MKLFLYFLVGLLLDILATVDIIAVQRQYALLSATMTLLLTVIGCLALAKIILSPDRIPELIAYGLGGGVGAYLTVTLL